MSIREREGEGRKRDAKRNERLREKRENEKYKQQREKSGEIKREQQEKTEKGWGVTSFKRRKKYNFSKILTEQVTTKTRKERVYKEGERTRDKR